jgi:D-alanyl-D-alanine carboxypeptidase/D-alanyl-D-alanine-endopeptidase (penicillin-binding protein 4)
MNKKILLLLTPLSLIFISWIWSETRDPIAEFEQKFPHAICGIVLYDQTAEKWLITHNEEKYFTPASVTKLFTAQKALNRFGPENRFETSLFINSSLDEGIIKGDIILVGEGDPLFNEDGLTHFAHHLKEMGVKTIQGSILIRAKPIMNRHAEVEDLTAPYFSLFSKVNLNRNGHLIHFIPTEPGDYAIQNPPLFDSEVSTVLVKDDVKEIEVTSSFYEPVKIEGAIQDTKDLFVPTLNLNEFITQKFARILENHGITVLNQISDVEEEIKVASHFSKPLSELVKEMLFESDNLIAEVLNIDLQPTPDIHLVDGSGLSRHNHLSPLEVHELLKNDSLDPYLPLAGVEGTLKNRFKNTFLERRLYAKTGGLDGVYNLGGYWINSHGHRMIFVFMLNHFTEGRNQALESMDQLLNDLFKSYD